MTEQLQPDALCAAFSGAFRREYEGDWAKTWCRNYVEHVRQVRNASEDEWMRLEFQEALWDRNPISTIGPGQSVKVVGAYGVGNSPRCCSMRETGLPRERPPSAARHSRHSTTKSWRTCTRGTQSAARKPASSGSWRHCFPAKRRARWTRYGSGRFRGSPALKTRNQ
jgi:hypothetical protein